MYLEKVSKRPPQGAEQLLLELGDGENGFGGTAFGRGKGTFQETLQALQDCEELAKLSPGFVPQTVFWVLDDEHQAVGMLRVRHRLNERLIHSGGNIGYYVRANHRNKGYATAGVRLAAAFLKSIGVERALITTQPANIASAKVAIANGGVPDTPGVHPDTGEAVVRYWIPT